VQLYTKRITFEIAVKTNFLFLFITNNDYNTDYITNDDCNSVFPADLLYLLRHILSKSFSPSGRRCWVVRERGFPGNAVHKASQS